jgi:hypothetical protein
MPGVVGQSRAGPEHRNAQFGSTLEDNGIARDQADLNAAARRLPEKENQVEALAEHA